ncbi:MAG: hypothetical protein V3V14_10775 [Saprospiraceae bacterium]
MRIIGEIPHPNYKISVLKAGERVTIQIENRLLAQSFIFRDGSGVGNVSDVQKILSDAFLSRVENRFEAMHNDYIDALNNINNSNYDDFEII